MEFGDLRPILDNIIAKLKAIERHTRCAVCLSSLNPIAATQAAGNPATIPEGYNTLNIIKTNGSGTVTITFPDASTYLLTVDGEEFTISGSPLLGEFTIAVASGATYKYYAY